MMMSSRVRDEFLGNGALRRLGSVALSSLVFASSIPALGLDVDVLRFRPEESISRMIQSTPAVLMKNAQSPIKAEEDAVVALFKEAVPSVVNVHAYDVREEVGTNLLAVPQGGGSGIIWSDDGIVVTNYHVIQKARIATVTMIAQPGEPSYQYPASLVGADPDSDIAVLKIDSNKGFLVGGTGQAVVRQQGSGLKLNQFKAIRLGSSADLQVGQSVFAIGNPFGLDHSLTRGIVSGLGREVVSPNRRPISNCIQTDAAINPGNSGGALLDSDGALVGMNTAILTPSGASAGVGFAVPVDTLKAVVGAILRAGGVPR
eukprot:CAMPEP_0194675264 /NCGR_PEP_ID=MMETSP0295-20121207/8160_1 /TAXON_ID=39354 /ORGANISM="Heterosigma akashiwo, Strain CCMP2393" /LENGTH=315 /DNA_ID=CAMNT_0039559577 /DNA_START=231 /DNA_END=1175 /DNA_ORIENTATION=+